MNLIGEKVFNARYGIGTIISVETDRMTVQFAEKINKYKYPDAFQKHLSLENEILQNEMSALATAAVEEKELTKKKEKEKKIKKFIKIKKCLIEILRTTTSSFVKRAVPFLKYTAVSIIISLLLLAVAFFLLGYKSVVYLDINKFDKSIFQISDGHVRLTSAKPIQWVLNGKDQTIHVSKPTYLSINGDIICDYQSPENDNLLVLLNLGGENINRVTVGSLDNNGIISTAEDKNRWAIESKVEEDKNLEVTLSDYDEKGNFDCSIREKPIRLNEQDGFYFSSFIYHDADIKTELKKEPNMHVKDPVSCEVWLVEGNDNNDYNYKDYYYYDDIDEIIIGNRSYIYLGFDTYEVDFDDFDSMKRYRLFSDINYFDLSLTGVKNVSLENATGEVCQYIGNDPDTRKFWLEHIDVSGEISASWLMQNGNPKLEITGSPEEVIISDERIKVTVLTWMRHNIPAIAIAICSAVFGGLYQSAKSNEVS